MKSDKKIAFKLNKVSKIYSLRSDKPTLAEKVLLMNKQKKFYSLKNVDLEVNRGEKLGIIGKNGSGKTTLLKIISRITIPTKGSVLTNGRIVSLIDLEAGFHPDLDGIENIYLNGLIIGMRHKQIKNRLKKIIKFADLGDFIDAPLYTYSQGMKLRLGLSVAVYSNPDILILDENFSAGDLLFRKKSLTFLENFSKKQNKTIIFVSHWLEYLKDTCDRIIWIDSGEIKADGDIRIIDKYQKYLGQT